ncbi:MAG: DUF2079 domain-containing protein [Acidobacteria bacterium]|nr:DUF2079 domain-containing protein [Acidobacteriota bacterium]
MKLQNVPRLLPRSIIVTTGVVCLAYCYGAFISLAWGYHDLGLSNDALASLIYHGKPFFVFELGVNHLSIIFSPSLFLLVPLYAFSQSQFLLVAAGAIGVFIGAWYALLMLECLASRAPEPWSDAERAVFSCTLVLLACWGTFTWNVITSTHFEAFFIPCATATLFHVLKGSRLRTILPWFLLALGIRQDGGFFLAFFLLSLVFLPQAVVADRRRFRWRVATLVVCSLAYTVATAKLVPWWFGLDPDGQARRLWQHYGGSFGEIALTMARSPWRVLGDCLSAPGFRFLNHSLLWLSWLNPLVGAATNIPGALYYTTSTPERQRLWWYSAAMLLPGMWVGVAAGLCRCQQWWRWCERALRVGRRGSVVAAAALLVMAASAPWMTRRASTSIPLEQVVNVDAWRTGARVRGFASQNLARCADVTTVSTDLRSLAVIPNRYGKFLPANYRRADAVLVVPGGDPAVSGFKSMDGFLAKVSGDDLFELKVGKMGMMLFVRKGLCAH